eukprot:scaffold75342_cov39-Attheya_sp.AAC.2
MVLNDGISTSRCRGKQSKQGMVAHQKSSPSTKIPSKLLALLASLDEMVPDFDWKVLGVWVLMASTTFWVSRVF